MSENKDLLRKYLDGIKMCLLQQIESDDLDFKKQKKCSLSFVFAALLIAVITIPNKSSLRKEGIVLAHFVSVYCIVAKKSFQQGDESAGHSKSTVRKQDEANVYVQSAFSI